MKISRRKFLKKIAGFIPIAFGLPTFLSGCIDSNGLFASNSDVGIRFDESAGLKSPVNISSLPATFSIAVVCDTHFYKEKNKNIIKLKDKILPSDEFMLIGGDLAQDGNIQDYLNYVELFDDIGLPYYSTIGNHDLFFNGWQTYKNIIGKSIYSLNLGNRIRLISMDSANGTVGKKQLDWLEGELYNSTEPIKIVLTHFHFFCENPVELQRYTDQEEVAYLINLFSKTNVDYVIMGHSHKYDYREIDGVRYLNVADMVDDGDEKNFCRININNNDMYHEQIIL